MPGASTVLVEDVHTPHKAYRGPIIFTHSWLALKLCLLIGEVKCLSGKSKPKQISKLLELPIYFITHIQNHRLRIEDLLVGSV